MIHSGIGNPLQVNPDQGLASASPFVLFVRFVLFVVSYAGFWDPPRSLALAAPLVLTADLTTMPLSRRRFTRQLLAASAAALASSPRARSAASPSASADRAPAVLSLSGDRPTLPDGIASGDVTHDSAVIWSRADRPARMIVEWSLSEEFTDVHRVVGPVADAADEYATHLRLRRLPPGRRIHYRVSYEGRGGPGEAGPATGGELLTASRDPADVFFAWGGDTCGQGYGIDERHGGLLTYDSIRRLRPDFFVHSGDLIYADNPIPPEIKLPDGTVWRNLVTEGKSKVAETLAEFRANYRYNFLDRHVRAFQAAIPVFAQWDDHEVRNNWYPGQKLDEDDRYTVKDVDLLAARARRAFFENNPVTPSTEGRIFRQVSRGPLCDLFFLDLRSYRAANSLNRQPRPGPDTAFLGEDQIRWFESAIRRSRALWKVVCCDMPLGLAVGDSGGRWEAGSNGDDGPPLGREFEIARLLRALREHKVHNVIWLTADVHYAAAHYYDPTRAAYGEFLPFWEFVSGPLHAGTFGPAGLDRTFGPSVAWQSRASGAIQNAPPSANEQFFGTVRIHARTGVASVDQYNRVGRKLWGIELPPAPAGA
ncbi:MAG: alkaline phosphatase [Limisphaerales bacterium]